MTDIAYMAARLLKRERELENKNERLRADNERLREWCRKLIEAGTFPREILPEELRQKDKSRV